LPEHLLTVSAMILGIEWSRPLQLRDGSRENLIYTATLDKIPEVAGIYIFGRRYAKNFEALYIGQATNIRGRVKGQFNNLKLMQHLKNARNGKRIVLAGHFKAKPGQKLKKCLDLAELAVIRHFLSEGHDLVNKQGVRLRGHEVESTGNHPKRYFPRSIYLQR
jgi:hypothetical protein